MTIDIDPDYAGEGIYRENILDHYKNPKNHGILEPADIKHKELNPLCGDQIQVTINISTQENGKAIFHSFIKEIKFIGRGCAISQSSMSMLSEKVKGMSIDAVKNLKKEDIIEMLSIPISPVRLKCALLGLDTVKNGIYIYEKYSKTKEGKED